MTALLLLVGGPFAAEARSRFFDGFDETTSLREAGSMSASTNPDWWVSSGGRFEERDGGGATIAGTLPENDPARVAYASANPVDTDDGYRPQNIFRMVHRRKWANSKQTVWFRILGINKSTSPNRNASNGVLFFNRYQDSSNLYYTGVRVDGTVVVKKKLAGQYTTLGQVRVYGSSSYDREARPNFVPRKRWLGLRSRVVTQADGSVLIRVSLDRGDGAGFVRVLEVRDTQSPIEAAGYTGIRSDFMDVEFEGYEVSGSQP